MDIQTVIGFCGLYMKDWVPNHIFGVHSKLYYSQVLWVPNHILDFPLWGSVYIILLSDSYQLKQSAMIDDNLSGDRQFYCYHCYLKLGHHCLSNNADPDQTAPSLIWVYTV